MSAAESKRMLCFTFLLLNTLHIAQVLSREITFPPVSGIQSPVGIAEDATDFPSSFASLMTFANVPFVDCFNSPREADKFDIAILGAPFDTVSSFPCVCEWTNGCFGVLPCCLEIFSSWPRSKATTGRPGARFGPTGIRTGSRRIYADAAWSVYTG